MLFSKKAFCPVVQPRKATAFCAHRKAIAFRASLTLRFAQSQTRWFARKPWEICASRKIALFALLFLLLPAALALDAPVVQSGTHQSDTWAPYPIEFTWAAVPGAIKYCYTYVSDPDAEVTEKNCTEFLSFYPPQKAESGDYYFHIKAVSPVEESSVTTYHTKLDIEGPSKPTLSARPLPDGTIEISWGASTDDASGLKEYQVYRKLMAGFTPRDTPLYTIVSASSTSFIDANNLDESTTYHYIVRPVDNAGNVGNISNEAFAATIAECDLAISFSTELASDQKSLLLKITGNDKIYRPSLKAVLPDGSEKVFFENAEPFAEWQESFGLTGLKQGYIDFNLSATDIESSPTDILGQVCSQQKRFVYDLAKPEISFALPKYNDRVSEVIPLQVKVVDAGDFKSGIGSVVFFLKEGSGWKRLGEGEEKSSGVYAFQWSSFSVENGQHKLKAEATDNGGNLVEATQTINVLNAFESAVDLNKAEDQTAKGRDNALAAKWAMEADSIYSEMQQSLIDWGDGNFAEAQSLAVLPGIENETNAKLMFAQAMLLYKQSETVVKTSVFKTADFIFNKEQVGILLNAAGVSGGTADAAKAAIEKADPKRKIEILKVQDGNATYYRALIVVSYSLDVNVLSDSNAGDLVMQIIEVVPKEFAEYAAELDSNFSFAVLYDDPKISFTLARDQYKKKQLVYALKKDLSEEQANALIENNVINKFVAPPIFMPVGMSGLGFALNVSSDLFFFIIIAVAIIAAIIIVALVLRKGFPKGKPAAMQKQGLKPSKQKFAVKKKEKPKKEFWKKGKPPGPGFKLPSFGKKKESPLSVFGKK